VALTMAEFQAFGKKPVLSPEETVTAEAYYQEHRQMNGLGQAHSGDYRDGLNRFGRLGAAPVTVVWGAGERDPQDLRTPGAGFRSAVAPGAVNAALSRPGGVGFARRVQLTRLVEELEALVGTAGVHPQILAQKAWDLRRALVGAGDWSWADYTDPRQAYDDKRDLEQRLLVIERLLGVGRLAPQLAGLSGLGCCPGLLGSGMSGLGAWNQPYYDPVAKLASCIRGALCMPQSFCCPPGTKFRPPARDRAESGSGYAPVSNSVLVADQLAEPRPPIGDTWVQPPPGDTWVQPPPGGPGDTWTQPPGGPSDQQILSDPYAAAKANRMAVVSRGGADANLLNDAFTRNKAAAAATAKAAAEKAAAQATADNVRRLEEAKRADQKRREAQQAKEQADAQAKLQAQPAPAPAVAVTTGQPTGYAFTSRVAPKTPEQNQWAAMQQNIRGVLKRSGAGGGASRGSIVSTGTHGLGASSLTSMPEINALRAKLRQARIEIARRRA